MRERGEREREWEKRQEERLREGGYKKDGINRELKVWRGRESVCRIPYTCLYTQGAFKVR